MKKIHCNGCGMSEDLDVPRPKIISVKLSNTLDSRDWAKDQVFEADLCGHCIGNLLHNYFGVDADGQLEVPAFIQPQGLRAVS